MEINSLTHWTGPKLIKIINEIINDNATVLGRTCVTHDPNAHIEVTQLTFYLEQKEQV